MQLMANKSHENIESTGLGWIDSEIVRFDFTSMGKNLKIPHVGGNSVTFEADCPLYKGIPNDSDFYFVHSYYHSLNEDIVTGSSNYGYQFTSSLIVQ
jgi:glutamine amidotransferase